MSAILNRYRLRGEVPPRRVSAEFAFGSPQLLHPVSIYLFPSIIQPRRDEALRHHAFPSQTTRSLSSPHLRPFSSRHASTPPNLNLFRRDNLLLAGEFYRDHEHGLAGYLLGALEVAVSSESLSTWKPKILGDEPKGEPLQITFLSKVKTRVVLGVHICARSAVYGWVLGTVEALVNQQPSLPNGGMGRTRDGIKLYPRTSQTPSPADQPTSVDAYERSRRQSVVHNRRDKSHRPHWL